MNAITQSVLAMVISAALSQTAFAGEPQTSNTSSAQTTQPDHFVLQSNVRIEDESNRTGNALKRAIINKAERNEAIAHEARYQGMITRDSDTTTVPQITVEDQVAQNTSAIAYHSATLLQHHSALVAAGKEMQNIRDTATDNTARIALEHNANETQQHFIAKNREEIVENANNIKTVNASVAGIQQQVAIQNGARVQGMIAAKHAAEQDAVQQQIAAQAATIPAAAIDHSQEIAANRVSIDTANRQLTDVKKQQKNDSAYYNGQIKDLAREASAAINSDRQQIASTQQRVESNAAQVSKLNSNFSSLKHTVDENKHEAAAGSSSAMAQANIPQVLNGQTVAIGVGVGGYDGESAIAVGVSFRAAESVTVKATVSDDSQQNVGYGAGVSVGW
ncbi:YadA C-terminal domain-containing protein [Pseudocitrobacter cyperus]|uniref:YadA-like family protein n=1 Tax=Pseudocitrobacter cyperus TaxID=3112843 RepID=A0ABV0HH10_9ENTR